MAKDVKVTGLQVSKIIASGSTDSDAKLLIYGIGSEDQNNPNQGVIDQTKFDISSIPSDTFLYVSGGIGGDITRFGGDVVIEGSIVVSGGIDVDDPFRYLYSDQDGQMKQSGSLALSGTLTAYNGLSGSLTKLTDGSSYLVAGNNITITSQSNGSVEVSAQPSFFVESGPDLIETTGSVEVQGVLSAVGGLSGSLTKLTDGSSYLVAGPAITITSQSNGSIIIEALTGSVGAPGGEFEIAYNVNQTLSASSGLWYNPGTKLYVSGGIFSPQLTGSLTRLSNGDPFITTIGGVSVATGSNGGLILSGTQGVTVHGGLSGLDQNDHPQYLLTSSFDVWSGSIEGDISDINQDISDLSGSVASDINTLDGRITTVSGQLVENIGVVTQSITALSTSVAFDINTLDGRITTVSGQLVENIGVVTQSITALSTSVAFDINDLANQISGQNSWVVANNVLVTEENVAISGTLEVLGGWIGLDASDVVFTPITNFTSSNVQSAFAEINLLSGSFASDINAVEQSISDLSGSVASDINGVIASVGVVTASVTALSGAVAFDINGLLQDVSDLSGSVATDINALDGRITTVSGQLVAHIGIVTASVTTLSTSVAFDINALFQDVSDLSGSVASDVNTLDGRITTVSGQLVAHIGIVTASVTALSTSVAFDINDLASQIGGQNSWTSINPGTTETDDNVVITGSLEVLGGWIGLEATDVVFSPITNFTSSHVQGAIAEVNLISGSFATRITDLSGSVASDINGVIASVGVVTASVTALSTSVATDINNLSNQIDNIITPSKTVTGTTYTVLDGDNNSIIYFNNASTVKVTIPSSLTPDIEVNFVQQGLGPVEFESDGNLFWSSPYLPTSSYQYATVTMFTSGADAYLAGELLVVDFNISASQIVFTPITNFTSSHVQGAIAEVNVISSSFATRITDLSGSVASDVNTLDGRITTVSGQLVNHIGVVTQSITALSTSVASDINGLAQDITDLSGSVAADINFLKLTPAFRITTGDYTLEPVDNGQVLYMSGASTNIVRVPPTLQNGFNIVVIQESAAQVEVRSTASLLYPTLFTSQSAQRNSMIMIYSSSFGLNLGGDLEPV
jgi:hypothetical protein